MLRQGVFSISLFKWILIWPGVYLYFRKWPVLKAKFNYYSNCEIINCFLKDKEKLFQSLRTSLDKDICSGKDLSLHFVTNGETIPKATEKTLPVVTREDNIKTVSFDWKKYQENLLTKVLGHVVFYSDVITSTQTVFDGLVFYFMLKSVIKQRNRIILLTTIWIINVVVISHLSQDWDWK